MKPKEQADLLYFKYGYKEACRIAAISQMTERDARSHWEEVEEILRNNHRRRPPVQTKYEQAETQKRLF